MCNKESFIEFFFWKFQEKSVLTDFNYLWNFWCVWKNDDLSLENMPLPPALLSRLQKRGIVKSSMFLVKRIKSLFSQKFEKSWDFWASSPRNSIESIFLKFGRKILGFWKKRYFFPGHEEVIAESYDSEGKDKRFEENPSGAPGNKPPRILAADTKKRI